MHMHTHTHTHFRIVFSVHLVRDPPQDVPSGALVQAPPSLLPLPRLQGEINLQPPCHHVMLSLRIATQKGRQKLRPL